MIIAHSWSWHCSQTPVRHAIHLFRSFLRKSPMMLQSRFIYFKAHSRSDLTDEEMKTSRKGIFACGDVRKKNLRQIATACGEGATAAVKAQHYIEDLKGTSYDPMCFM